jgi:hypothetical protein
MSANSIRVYVRLGILLFTLLLRIEPLLADVVSDWNEKAIATMAAERMPNPIGTARILSMVHTAMFNAARTAAARPTVLLVKQSDGTSTTLIDVAVHAAGALVLSGLYPKQKAALDAVFKSATASLPDSSEKSAAIKTGEEAADAMLASRKNDGFESPDTYRPITSPGVYVPTSLPIMSYVAGVKPFALKTVSQFRPDPPPALNSSLWARDYNEVKELGGINSTQRTADQTEAGRFWVLSGTLASNQVARELLATKPLSIVESARLFANLNVAMTDAFVAIFDAKYQYGFWRPITAIRNGDRDENPATDRDPGWKPLIDTPMHPEYPCAHCVCDGAAGVILESVFGTGTLPSFSLTFAGMPGVVRQYTSLHQLDEEVSMARIWGGVHYRTSTEVGRAMGKKGRRVCIAELLTGREPSCCQIGL